MWRRWSFWTGKRSNWSKSWGRFVLWCKRAASRARAARGEYNNIENIEPSAPPSNISISWRLEMTHKSARHYFPCFWLMNRNRYSTAARISMTDNWRVCSKKNTNPPHTHTSSLYVLMCTYMYVLGWEKDPMYVLFSLCEKYMIPSHWPHSRHSGNSRLARLVLPPPLFHVRLARPRALVQIKSLSEKTASGPVNMWMKMNGCCVCRGINKEWAVAGPFSRCVNVFCNVQHTRIYFCGSLPALLNSQEII